MHYLLCDSPLQEGARSHELLRNLLAEQALKVLYLCCQFLEKGEPAGRGCRIVCWQQLGKVLHGEGDEVATLFCLEVPNLRDLQKSEALEG